MTAPPEPEVVTLRAALLAEQERVAGLQRQTDNFLNTAAVLGTRLRTALAENDTLRLCLGLRPRGR